MKLFPIEETRNDLEWAIPFGDMHDEDRLAEKRPRAINLKICDDPPKKTELEYLLDHDEYVTTICSVPVNRKNSPRQAGFQ